MYGILTSDFGEQRRQVKPIGEQTSAKGKGKVNHAPLDNV